jgi:hypothetical protein
MPKPLPSRPNLEQLKKQAKDLRKAHDSGAPDAIRRVRESHPQRPQTATPKTRAARLSVNDAQLVIAREYGRVPAP